MSDNKKYYYMKVKENFFDTDEMIVLESMPDGYLYTNILLKLYLRSLKDNGRLMFKGLLPYTPDVLSRVVRHNVGVVEKAIQIFKQLGLVEILDNGAIYMLDIQNFIGESSTEADRIRSWRKQVEEQKQLVSVTNVRTNVTTNVQQMYDKSTPEIEIEKEKKDIADSDECGGAFNQFWKLYPSKKGKANALKSWRKQWKTINLETVLTGTQSYIEFCKSTQRPYKDGSTFVNGQCWNDDWTVSEGGGTSDIAKTGRAAKYEKKTIQHDLFTGEPDEIYQNALRGRQRT